MKTKKAVTVAADPERKAVAAADQNQRPSKAQTCPVCKGAGCQFCGERGYFTNRELVKNSKTGEVKRFVEIKREGRCNEPNWAYYRREKAAARINAAYRKLTNSNHLDTIISTARHIGRENPLVRDFTKIIIKHAAAMQRGRHE